MVARISRTPQIPRMLATAASNPSRTVIGWTRFNSPNDGLPNASCSSPRVSPEVATVIKAPMPSIPAQAAPNWGTPTRSRARP